MQTTLTAKAQAIKLVIFDVDGVFTDGRLYMNDSKEVMISFYIHDGLGVQLLQRAGIQVGIISGRASTAVKNRAEHLGIQHVYIGCANKLTVYTELKGKLSLTNEQIAFVGDDWIDIPAMKLAGLKLTVPNAVAEIKALADWETPRSGGQGAVRDICDLILKAQGHFDTLLASYYQ